MTFVSYLAIGVLVASVAVVTWVVVARRGPRLHEIATSGELKRKYGLTSEGYIPPKIDEAKIPEALRPLVPMALEWGIADDIIRDDKQKKSTREQRIAFRHAVEPHMARICAWLDERREDYSDEVCVFLYMSEAIEEVRVIYKDLETEKKTGEPGATDNPGDAQ